MQLKKKFRFEASHILSKHPGKCSRLHGHSWVLHVMVEGPVNPDTGFVMDYGDISKAVKPIVEDLDHRHLGVWDVFAEDSNIGTARCRALPLEFYSTSENLLMRIAELLMISLPQWSALSLEETCTSEALLLRCEYDQFVMDQKERSDAAARK